MCKELKFYNRPLRLDTYGTYLWDSKGNMVAQFDKTVKRIEREVISWRLNALDKNTEEIPDYNLVYDSKKGLITNNGENFIEIRGWGGLTGVGGYNLSSEIAITIQEDFAQWLIERLTK